MKLRTLFTVFLMIGLFLFFRDNETGNASEVFPSRTVELILSGGPGGGTDVGVRIIGPELSKALGVPVIFTNKGGGSGTQSVEYVSGAKPDGYTILAASGNLFTVTLILTPGLPYKISDFIPICKYANAPNLFVVSKASPFKKFEDLISYAKKNPGKLTCATSGTGTAAHFSLEMLKIEAGIDVVHMPSKSAGEVTSALLGGQVDFVSHSFGALTGLMQSGDVRGLASISYEKLPGFPNIPTLVELGYGKSILLYWLGFYLPKGTPKPVVDKLASVFEKTLKSPSVKKNLENAGYMLNYQDGAAVAKLLPEEYKVIEEVSKKANLIK